MACTVGMDDSCQQLLRYRKHLWIKITYSEIGDPLACANAFIHFVAELNDFGADQVFGHVRNRKNMFSLSGC